MTTRPTTIAGTYLVPKVTITQISVNYQVIATFPNTNYPPLSYLIPNVPDIDTARRKFNQKLSEIMSQLMPEGDVGCTMGHNTQWQKGKPSFEE